MLFSGEDDESSEPEYIYGKDVVALAKEKAVFIRVPYCSDREPSFSDGSPVPLSKILGKNPSRDYEIKTYPTMLVCDSFGNEFYRMTSKPEVSSLKKKIEAVADQQKKLNDKLQKGLDAAKTAFEAKDRAKTLKTLIDNFRTGAVGLSAQEGSVKLYHEIVEAGRKEMNDLLAAGGKDLSKKLTDMKREFKDTELVKELDTAIKGLK